MSYIDLHVHTTASDGSFSPAGIVRYAAQHNIRALGITDHDTVAGNREALEEGLRLGITVIPGVEISIGGYPGTVHLLGYFGLSGWEGIEDVLTRVKDGREIRNKRIIHKLKEMGMELNPSRIQEISGDGIMGRPHIARAMVEAGYVGDVDDAFRNYLKKGAPAYVDRYRMGPREAISSIREFGGMAAIAHPSTIGMGTEEMNGFIEECVESGLEGLEVFAPIHDQDETESFLKIAERFKLILTGGTDFHGSLKPDIEIGKGFGNLKIPFSVFDSIKGRLGI